MMLMFVWFLVFCEYVLHILFFFNFLIEFTNIPVFINKK